MYLKFRTTNLIITIILLSISWLSLSTDAFSNTAIIIGRSHHHHHYRSIVANNKRVQLCMTQQPSDDDDDEDPDIESARRQLESLVGTTKGDDDDDEFSMDSLLSTFRDFDLPKAPPMTSMDRDRRLAEIEVLQRLTEGDEATSELWNLWYSERGPQAQARLGKSDGLLTNPSNWEHCEQLLLALIQEFGVYFVEPVNRLATLYYLQGRYEQSYKLCKIILQIKPWHFGALSGIVSVCIAKGDREEARIWASRRLPTFVPNTSPFTEDDPENPRRQEWVERAVADAREALERAEQRTQQSFGKPEDYYKNKSNNNKDSMPSSKEEKLNNYNNNSMDSSLDNNTDDDEDDAWQ